LIDMNGRVWLSHLARWLLLVPPAILVAGCFLPDDYQLDIIANRDGSYTVDYVGDLIFAPGYAELKQGKGNDHDKGFTDIAATLREEPGFKSVEYKGQAGYRVTYHWEGKLDKSPYVFVGDSAPIFKITKQVEGTIELASAKLKKDDLAKLDSLGLSSHGKVSVKTDGKVVKHNATSEPGIFSKSYGWTVNNFGGEGPMMVIAAQ
jgi:hypothetical protein